MADSFSKKENNKKKVKKLQEKSARREERKSNNNKGKSLEDLFIYVDVNGQLTNISPSEQNQEADLQKAKQQKIAQLQQFDINQKGFVNFISDKGYGFITEDVTGETIFFHQSENNIILQKGQKVSYQKISSQKGHKALEIKTI